MSEEQEVPLKIKIITYAIGMVLTLIMIAGTIGYASYQRNQKAERQKQAQIAAALLKQQTGNVEKLKATLPLFRQTKQGAEMSIVKVSVEDLPKTIDVTGTIDIMNQQMHSGDCDGSDDPIPYSIDPEGEDFSWAIFKDGSAVSRSNAKNGWDIDFSLMPTTFPGELMSYNGVCYTSYPNTDTTLKVSIPGSALPGKYKVSISDAALATDTSIEFKITLPCPTVQMSAS